MPNSSQASGGFGDALGRLRASTAEGTGSIPGWGTKIPHACAAWPKKEGKIERNASGSGKMEGKPGVKGPSVRGLLSRGGLAGRWGCVGERESTLPVSHWAGVRARR